MSSELTDASVTGADDPKAQKDSDTADPTSDQLKLLADEVDKAIIDISKKGKKKGSDTSSGEQTTTEAPASQDEGPTETVDVKRLTDEQLIMYLQLQELQKQQERQARRAMKGKDPDNVDHKFWNTQPMLALKDEVASVEDSGPIDTATKIEDIKKEPYNMPAGFSWVEIDINDNTQAHEMYTLLTENYVEDDECVFRFDYSVPFLQWALSVPGYLPSWHVGVRNTKTGTLMGCITAIPVHIRVYDKVIKMAEINFLCVHKKLRTKRLAPVLIKEITRRVNLEDQWQAVYTAGVVLPKPVARCQYFHRSLNVKKLIEVRFSSLPPRTSLAAHIKRFKLPANPVHRALRPMTAADVPAVHKLLTNYLDTKTQLAQQFTEAEIAHMLLPRDGVVKSFVLKSGEGGDASTTITDFCSYYYLPSSVLRHPQHNKLNAVYSYYNVATTMDLTDLMKDLLILARNDGADVFNALDLMDNRKPFGDLLFGPGDGHLQYYVYNWKCPVMQPNQVGLVLL